MQDLENSGAEDSVLATIFPGQGSQKPGMGMDFYETYSQARSIFDQADAALPFSVKNIIDNDELRLNETAYTQPCILTVEIAMLSVLRDVCGYLPNCFAGHSLGEYTALVAAGVIPFEAAVAIVHQRGTLMQNVTPLGFGAMAAVIMDDLPAQKIADLAAKNNVDVANDNSKNQLVISGQKSPVEQVCKELEATYQDQEIRVVPLTVSAPFHSRHMTAIEEPFRQVLQKYQDKMDVKNLSQVVSNYTGTFYKGGVEELIENLTKQLSGRVKWQDNMLAIKEKTAEIIELGPHRPLSGFFKTIDVPVKAILNLRSAKKNFKELETV